MAAGLNAAYNPFWKMLNPRRIGLAGHSFGAAGVSYIGQKDPRVTRSSPGTTSGARHERRPAR